MLAAHRAAAQVIFEQKPPVAGQPFLQIVAKIELEFGANCRSCASKIRPNAIARAFELLRACALPFHCLQSFFHAIL
jgi:hypothetical protein